jgi:predicted sulfurtransferase
MAAEAQAKKYVMLDVRNDYEWDAGHFQGAARPAEEEFNDTPVRGLENY